MSDIQMEIQGIRESSEVTELYKALVGFQSVQTPVKMDSTNPHFNSGYVSLQGLIEATRENLGRHGLGVIQFVRSFGRAALVTTRLVHVSGQFVESSMYMHPGKDGPQALGSAITYLRRYSYQAILGLAAVEDDDAEKSEHRGSSHQESKQAPKKEGRRDSKKQESVALNSLEDFASDDSNLNCAAYQIPFGKYKGKLLVTIPLGEAVSYAKFLLKMSVENNKPITGGPIEEFLKYVNVYLNKSKELIKDENQEPLFAAEDEPPPIEIPF